MVQLFAVQGGLGSNPPPSLRLTHLHRWVRPDSRLEDRQMKQTELAVQSPGTTGDAPKGWVVGPLGCVAAL